MNQTEDMHEVDLLQLLGGLWKRIWIVLLVGVIIGGSAYYAADQLIDDKYQSNSLFYIDNRNVTTASDVGVGDIAAAKSLVFTAQEVLKSRSVLDIVRQDAGLPYTVEALRSMVRFRIQGTTELFYVGVRTKSPELSLKISKEIEKVLPARMKQIVTGSNLKLVDSAVLPVLPVYPNRISIALKTALIGMILTLLCLVIILLSSKNFRENGTIRSRKRFWKKNQERNNVGCSR